MNWIDEKIDEYGSKFYPTVGYNRYHEEAEWIRTALADSYEKGYEDLAKEAHQRGVEEERKRVLEWVKKHEKSLTDCNVGWKHRKELDDFINLINTPTKTDKEDYKE